MVETITPVVHGGRRSRWIADVGLHVLGATLAAAVLAFSASNNSSVLSAAATSRAKISRNCKSLSVNARGSVLSTLNVPVTVSCNITGTVIELRAF